MTTSSGGGGGGGGGGSGSGGGVGGANTSNGKHHVRSHSLRSFPAVAAAVLDGSQRLGDDRGSQVAVGSDPQAINGGCSNIHPAVKMTSTWKQACDRTRDRTKQLLRRTMSWKSNSNAMQSEERMPDDTFSTALEIHVWASWMKRYASEDEPKKSDVPFELAPLQEEKLLNFFKYYLDGDCDGFVFEHDFHQFAEKLRRFADWSPNSDEYIILKQVLKELVQVFIPCETGQNVAFVSLSTDDWLKIWCQTLSRCSVASDMPLWLKYFQNILFKALDSGNGKVEKENLQRFYCTFLDSNCEEVKQVVIDAVYDSLTSNGDFRLDRDTWGQCFANWLLGTKPNGSGQWLFGKCGPSPEFFPIDYSAMNSTVDTRDTYSHKRRSDRHSVVV